MRLISPGVVQIVLDHDGDGPAEFPGAIPVAVTRCRQGVIDEQGHTVPQGGVRFVQPGDHLVGLTCHRPVGDGLRIVPVQAPVAEELVLPHELADRNVPDDVAYRAPSARWRQSQSSAVQLPRLRSTECQSGPAKADSIWRTSASTAIVEWVVISRYLRQTWPGTR